jgi:CMP-N-acetylneuraminic acid synthetase
LYGKKVLGYEIDPARSVNIDTAEDWELAERMKATRQPQTEVHN